jgi:2-polyprenyl-6-methoxyphenol hydroxylase-like FAD-dependent oxidoreductase
MSDIYDVAIVGAGPVGLTAALLAAKAGLRTALIERRAAPIGYPAGHVLNQRSLEIWRQIAPDLEASIRNDSASLEQLRLIVWCASLAGTELARIRLIPQDPAEMAELLSQSPSRQLHYPQSRLEAQLWRAVEAIPSIDFHKGTKVGQVSQDGGQVTIDTEGAGRLTARYCLAADGARSSIREGLGIAMPGPLLARVASVNFKANLDRFIRCRPAVIYWIYNRHLVGPLIRHLGDEWILMAMLHPPQEAEQFDEQHWRRLIAAAIGTPAVDVKIQSIGGWAMTAQVAERMREGRVFLVGDAAHRFPPTGGYGINTGVQDVHNLIWKLKAVIDGHAGDILLDSYDVERKAVAHRNCARSVKNQDDMDQINAAVALRQDDVRRLHAMMERPWFRGLPHRFQLKIAEVLPRLGLRKIARLEADDARGRRMRQRLSAAAEDQRAHFGGAHAVDLGYRYDSALTLSCPVDPAELSPSDTEYRPGSVPGIKLAHGWLDHEGTLKSSHDLVDYEAFTLVTDAAGADPWARALAEASSRLLYPVRLVTVAEGDDSIDAQPAHRWPSRCGVNPGGAILVRPDGHVAWRARDLPAAPASALGTAFSILAQAFG